MFKGSSCPVSFCRQWRAWDFTQEAGLILAGGIIPWTDVVERSTDYGKSFQQIQTMPYGGNGRNQRTQQRTAGRVAGACLVIVDATTVFVAGGWFGKLILVLSYWTNLKILHALQVPRSSVTHGSLTSQTTLGHRGLTWLPAAISTLVLCWKTKMKLS